eukprot:scaffold55166_cov30-Tisochrysis_lutea.AAC.2
MAGEMIWGVRVGVEREGVSNGGKGEQTRARERDGVREAELVSKSMREGLVPPSADERDALCCRGPSHPLHSAVLAPPTLLAPPISRQAPPRARQS